MKKLTLIVLCIILASIMCSCKYGRQGHLDIDKQIEEMLLYLDYTDCHVTSIGDYYNCKTTSVLVNQQEVDEIVKQYLEQYPSENKTDKAIIEEGDLVIISYKVFDSYSTIMDIEKQVVLAGVQNFDALIEQSVIGKKIGQTYFIEYNNSDLGIQNAQCMITPQYIYTLSDAQLNDAFVQTYFNYCSVEEWEDSIRKELENQKKEEAWIIALDDIIECSSFDINQECILEQATNLAYQTEIQSTIEGLTIEEYTVQNMGLSKEEFYNECYFNCLRDVQEYLVVGVIAFLEELEVTELEFTEYCSEQELDQSSLPKEEKTYVFYYILRNKVINLVCS